MTDDIEKFSDPILMAPVQTVVIGTGTGDGGPARQLIETPEGQPNVVVTYIGPLVAIGIRFITAFLTMLVSLIGAGMTTNIIPATDFLNLVLKCATLSVAGAGFGLLKDLLTVFSKLEQKFPLLRA